MTHEFHNPDNLTPEQIGEGYRLLLKSEIKPRPENREINAWLGRFRRWTDHNDSMCEGSSQDLTYRVPLSTWPLPEPEIKWKAEREAFARGETVEAQLTSGWAPDTWIPLDANFERDWNTLFAARIKPWTLGNSVNGFTLGKGQQWHRLDWTKDMLPEGWRPHTDGEVNGDGDQWLSQSGWRNVAAQEGGSSSGPFCAHCRTRRPLPPTESPPTDNDSWECLLRTNAQLGKKVVELEKDSDFWKSRYEDAINATSFIQEEKESLGLLVGQDTVTDGILALRRQRNELQSKLTAAQARLEQLEWRPVSVKPTKEDADIHGHVLICRKDGDTGFGSIYVAWTPEVTHWRPAALPTIPDQSRVEFEKWWKSNGVSGFLEEAAFDLWNAARKEEKV